MIFKGGAAIITIQRALLIVLLLNVSGLKAETLKMGAYIGGGVGASSLTPEVPANSFLLSNKSSSTGYRLFAGYEIFNKANLEFVYTDLGEATFSHQIQPGLEIGGISYAALSILGSYDIYRPIERLGIYVKAGLSTIQNESTSAAIPFNQEANMQFNYGIGAQLELFKGFSVRADFDQYSSDANLVSLSLAKEFTLKSRRLGKLFLPSDKDDDGVPDDQDLCPDTPRLSVLNVSGCPDESVSMESVKEAPSLIYEEDPVTNDEFHAAQEEIDSLDLLSIDFKGGTAELTDVALIVLDLLADILLEYEGVQMRVQVHTDNVGTPEHNLRLSKKRANTIKGYLINLNVNATRIYAQGFGEAKPITSNETSNGRARNRRVGISIR